MPWTIPRVSLGFCSASCAVFAPPPIVAFSVAGANDNDTLQTAMSDMQESTTVGEEDVYSYMPSRNQQIVISAVQIPTSLLSFVGSALIIYNIRKMKKKTPYRRILLALSICDILSTIGWLLQPFLTPKDAPDPWVWAVGNDATCVMLGAFSQFGFSAHLYSGLLSFYFLLTVKFGMREEQFQQKYERWCHGIILIFSVSTAIAGIFLKVFRPMIVAPGCWVSAPPEGCSEDCPEESIAWIFGGIPSMLMLLCTTISNMLLYCHVRSTILQGQQRSMANQSSLANFGQESNSQTLTVDGISPKSKKGPKDMADSASGSVSLFSRKSTTSRSVLNSSDKQWKRVRDVGKQSFLYVGAYLLSFGWSYAVNILDSRDYEYQPESGKVLFPLLVLQSIFLSCQGFFNAIIFFRPKYLQARVKYLDEPKWWVLQQAILGETFNRPSSSRFTSNNSQQSQKQQQQRQRSNKISWATRINMAGEFLSSRQYNSNSSSHVMSRVDEQDASNTEEQSALDERKGQEEEEKQ